MVKVKFTGFGSDKEVEVASGELLLRAAKDNGVKIPCDCQDGECGSCAVEVVFLGDKDPQCERLDSQGKELTTLIGRGVYTKADAEGFEMSDKAPGVRLACQCIVRNDILVKPYQG